MVDETGNKLTWLASGEPRYTEPLPPGGEDVFYDGLNHRTLERGLWYEIKATVKKHALYKSEPTTYITRCKILKAIEPPIASAA